jgi:nucleoid-associated protein YgaU
MVLNQALVLSKPSFLRLRAKHKNNEIYLSEQIITIGALKNKAKPYVVLAKPQAGSLMVQSSGRKGDIALEVVDYDEEQKGVVIFAGRARAGAKVKLYYNNKFIGETTSARDDKWQLSVEGLSAGVGQLRLDLLDAKEGKVIARIELPFKMEKNLKQGVGEVIIQPGDSLWKLARNLYGKGVLYTIIYEHNQDNIKDPNLIYPGQIFEAPTQ